MMPIRRILVPVDFSEGSRAALRYAAGLAESFGATIEALHVWEPAPYITPSQLMWMSSEPASFWARVHEDLERQLEAMVDAELGKTDTVVERRVLAGYVSESILRAIETSGADLVIMGTHGRTGLRHILLGSVAERVVRLSTRPVLTMRVPRGAEEGAEHPTEGPKPPADVGAQPRGEGR
jgi:nucleotide-binding universal stress UspA family protein